MLAAAAALSVGGAVGVGGIAARWWDRKPGDGLVVLSDDEYAFIQAIAEAWMPRGGTPELSGADANLGGFIDESLERSNDLTRKGLKLLMQALDDVPVPSHLSAYRNLPLDVRQELLAAWLVSEATMFRRGVQGVMALVSLGWTIHPDVAAFFAPSFGCGYGA